MEIVNLKQLLETKINECGYELYSIKLERKQGDLTLSLVVDRVKEIDMDAIVELTHVLSDYLDEINPIEEAYQLDISSLGAEKPLKVEALENYIDSFIHVHLTNPIDGENIYEGTLTKVNEDNISIKFMIKTRAKEIEILKSNILSVRLAIKF